MGTIPMKRLVVALIMTANFSVAPFEATAQDEAVDPDSPEAKSQVTLANDSLRAYAASTEMAFVAGGEFEGETIGDFYMDVHLVTLGQYRACVAAGVCVPPPENELWSDSWKKEDDRLPINNVNWFNARTYAAWVGKRLPTESEWEWAARGGDEARTYPWGNEEPTEGIACWMRYDGDTDTGDGPCPVGQHAPSRDGIYDLSGNLWELTSTFGDESKRLIVLKGGAWYNDVPAKLQVANRGLATIYHRDASSDGIRLVVSAADRDGVFKLEGQGSN